MIEKYHGQELEVKFNLNGRWVGDGCPIFVIAEAGSNHSGRLDWARELIDIAADAGADAVKFQVWKAEELYSDPWYKQFELPREWIPELARYCASKIQFLASAFDREAVDLIDPFVPAFKIASRSYCDMNLLSYVAAKDKLVIASKPPYFLGPDIFHATVNQRKLILLHCVPRYPTELQEIEMWRMEELKFAGTPVGFSDHTLGNLAAIAAVARGACVIEKHFTLDGDIPSPDHGFSVRPAELRKYIQTIRDTELAVKPNIQQIEQSRIKSKLRRT